MTRGRPPKLDKQLLDTFKDRAAYCASIDDVCDELGISRRTYFDWIRDGKTARAGSHKHTFRTVALSARLVQKNRLLSVLYAKALDGDVSAAKYLLDRVHKLAAHVHLTGSVEHPTQTADAASVDWTKLTPAELEQVHASLARVMVAPNTGEEDATDDDATPDA